MSGVSLWLQGRDLSVLSSRCSSELRYSLGTAVSAFFPSEGETVRTAGRVPGWKVLQGKGLKAGVQATLGEEACWL